MVAKAKTRARGRKGAKEKLSLAALEAATTAYYDGLSGAEVVEDKLWGEFAGTHLALKQDERASLLPLNTDSVTTSFP
jgi:hypothetical protein